MSRNINIILNIAWANAISELANGNPIYSLGIQSMKEQRYFGYL